MTRTAHEAAAVEWGGHLVYIHSKEENEFISKTLSTWTWVGLEERVENNWEWSDGTPFDYSNWKEGEPNNRGGEENVGAMYINPGVWNDALETMTKPGIYKKRSVH